MDKREDGKAYVTHNVIYSVSRTFIGFSFFFFLKQICLNLQIRN